MPSALFLHHIRYLLDYSLCRMHLMPEHARHKELYYRQFWRCHKKSANDIASKLKFFAQKNMMYSQTYMLTF